MPFNPTRRWSKRTLVLAVLGLVTATAVLTVGIVGFARSVDFVTRIGAASEVINDVAQISPEVTSGGSTSVTPGANASGGPGVVPFDPAVPSAPAPAPQLSAGQGVVSRAGASGAAPGEVQVAGPADAAGAGGAAGATGTGGAGGASGAPVADAVAGGGGGAGGGWQGALQSMLTVVAQNTTQMCGPNTCNVGQVCCNFSCGTCVAPGATCDQTLCAGAARTPTAVRCGSGQCNDGQVCCNPSCGICAAPGATCSTETCP